MQALGASCLQSLAPAMIQPGSSLELPDHRADWQPAVTGAAFSIIRPHWQLARLELTGKSRVAGQAASERLFVLLEGEGVRLHSDDGKTTEVRQACGTLRMAGTQPGGWIEPIGPRASGVLLDWQRGEVDVQLWQRSLQGSLVMLVGGGETWGLHLLSGSLQISDAAGNVVSAARDTVLLDAPQGRARYVVHGHGEVLLLRVAQVMPS